ncbi:MAG: ArnT family glycosyltransferase [Candidatus Nanohaloarchaea archaeon]
MERREKLLAALGILFAAGFMVRFFPLNLGYHYWDQAVYLQHAEIILGGPANYTELDFRPPLISILIAPLYAVFGVAGAHFTVALLSALIIPATYFLGRTLLGREEGVLSALGVASSPLLIEWSRDVMVDPVLPLFWVATAYLVARSSEKWRFASVAGVATAAAVLTKFTSLVLVPASLLVMGMRHLETDLLSAAEEVLQERRIHLYLTGFAAGMTPYLVWSRLRYGGFFHTFSEALRLSGFTDPFLTYLRGFPEIIAPLFLLGVVGLYQDSRSVEKYKIPAVYGFSLLGALQFLIGNRELRFLTPVVPFIAVLGSAGIYSFREKAGRLFWPAVILFTAVSLAPFASDIVDDYRGDPFIEERAYSTAYRASIWLKENTQRDAVVYSDNSWPILGYYSDREIVVIPYGGPREPEDVFDRSGYMYHSYSAYHAGEVGEYINSTGDFSVVKRFDGATIYRYGG